MNINPDFDEAVANALKRDLVLTEDESDALERVLIYDLHKTMYDPDDPYGCRDLYAVYRVSHPGEKFIAIRAADETMNIYEAGELPEAVVSQFNRTLKTLMLPVLPSDEIDGCDGTFYELEIGSIFGGATYRWWCEPPQDWRPLVALAYRFEKLLKKSLTHSSPELKVRRELLDDPV